jgi:drug/metabolite transporter (DMT)-like permease
VSRPDALLLLALGAAWGAVYPLTSVALDELPPSAVIFVRTGLSALMLVPLVIRRGTLAAVRANPVPVVVAALLQATIPLVLLTTGQQHVSAGLAGILVASQPVWVAALVIVIDRAIHIRQLLGVLTGLAGVSLIFLRDVGIAGTSGWGAAALLAAAIFFAAGAVWIERRIPEVPPAATAATAMTISALALAPFAATASLRVPSVPTLVWLLVLGLVATGGALVLFYWLIQRVGAVRANLAGYLAPGFAVIYGVTFLGERASSAAIAGLGLIIVGSAFAANAGKQSHPASSS